MVKQMIITKNPDHNVTIESDMNGQDLYEAYVALTAHIISQLNSKKDISNLASTAVQDALNLIAIKNTAIQ